MAPSLVHSKYLLMKQTLSNNISIRSVGSGSICINGNKIISPGESVYTMYIGGKWVVVSEEDRIMIDIMMS